MREDEAQPIDVVIIGGGPSGLEAALVVARAQKRILVFDDPREPRNSASHGIHNFIGAEGLKPAELREVCWKEIAKYGSAELRQERVTAVARLGDQGFAVVGSGGSRVSAARLILAFGYHDEHPALDGFEACWGHTIIPCPFCDGYENRGRAWGVVPRVDKELALMPKLAQHWASSVQVFLSPDLPIGDAYRSELTALGISLHKGPIAALHHRSGRLEAVTLESGDRHQVGTLLWVPKPRPAPLADLLEAELGLHRDEEGFIRTDESFATNLPRVWAVGDVKGWAGGLGAAAAGYTAATSMLKSW
jgi:thioredoxin reductase